MADQLDRLRSALSDRYTIEREIGSGGMAAVYLAEDLKHRRKVAIKILRPDLAATLGSERFLREIEVAAQLNHPHILPLLDSGETDGFLYYAMPHVSGGSLRQRLLSTATLPSDDVARIVREVARALEHAHRRGVIHRDIKPENILFSEGLAVVADFGIARVLGSISSEALTRSGFPLGTPGYMSPEQAAGNTALDVRTDVCSLACVVYEMLIGETPGVWSTPDEVRVGRFLELPQGHREILGRLPGRVEQVLVQGLAIRPAHRPATPVAFADALAAVLEPGAKLGDPEVREILRRAAELEVQAPTEDGVLSLGGVEQIAAEVGIPPVVVREAAEAVDRPETGIARGGYLGMTGRIELESTVAAPTSQREYSAMLEEIRTTIGEAGRVNETFDQSFFWEGRLPTVSARKVQVTVIPTGERCKVRIVEHRGEDVAVPIASIVAGSLVSVLACVAVARTGDSGLAGWLTGVVIWVGQYGAVRAAYHRFLKKRFRILQGLLKRLSRHAAGAGAPALSAGDDPTLDNPGSTDSS